MIKDENYITIQGWMVNDLKLDKMNLLVYAIIYGFCQDGDSCFNGSLEYLCDWTGCTRQGITNILKHLQEDNLITKTKGFPNNIYRVVRNAKVKVHEEQPVVDTNAYTKKVEEQKVVDEVISFMNTICGTKFKASANGSKKYVKSLTKQGYTVDDMKAVILSKFEQWGRVPKKFSNGEMSDKYLRPSTILGSKFDEYLAEANRGSEGVNTIQSIAPLKDRSNMKF